MAIKESKYLQKRRIKLVEESKRQMLAGVGAMLAWFHSLSENDKWILTDSLEQRTGRVGEARQRKKELSGNRTWFGMRRKKSPWKKPWQKKSMGDQAFHLAQEREAKEFEEQLRGLFYES